MLVISTQNWSISAKFAKKNPSKSSVFYWLFLGEDSPQNFPWNRPIFLRICPENPSKFDFFPLKSREIGRFFREFAPENPAKFCFFFREISEALTCIAEVKGSLSGRGLHQFSKGQGFESCTSLNFFSGFLYATAKVVSNNCDLLSFKSLCPWEWICFGPFSEIIVTLA